MQKPQDTYELTAVVLAAGVAIAVIALSIGASVAEASAHLNFSEPAATTLSTVLGAAVGAIAGYIGRGRQEPPVEEPPLEEEPGEQVTREWPRPPE